MARLRAAGLRLEVALLLSFLRGWALGGVQETELSQASSFDNERRSAVATLVEKAHAAGFKLLSPSMPSRSEEPELTAIALHLGHDASVAISIGGRVQCVLELERLYGERYYMSKVDNPEQFVSEWNFALKQVHKFCECEHGSCPKRFDVGLYVPEPWIESKTPCFQQARSFVEEIWPVERWQVVDHHEAHARLGFFASPFKSALIISMDGGGNDGYFNAYLGRFPEITRLVRLNYNLGVFYSLMSYFVQEVSGISLDDICSAQPDVWMEGVLARPDKNLTLHVHDSWAGKMMGYAAVAAPDEALLLPILTLAETSRQWVLEANDFGQHHSIQRAMDSVISEACNSLAGQRSIAATTQLVFEEFVLGVAKSLLPLAGGKDQIDGVVLTGGCALNVLSNQRLEDALELPVYVPPGPNDGGISVGALWAARAPPAVAPLQYLGFHLWDREILEDEAHRWGATKLGSPEMLAELLTGADRPIVAVVRGRQEFGPRALGHRSLLAVPDSVQLQQRMNTLKHRQWYRPIAPMIAVEALEKVFGRTVLSPYMEKAPVVLKNANHRFPALAHIDGTARHQSVSRADEPWLHRLLLAVGKITGLAALINTSFNTKGKPMVNEVAECLELLDKLPDLDYVLIEDWLFKKARP